MNSLSGGNDMNYREELKKLKFTNYWMFSAVMSQQENLWLAKRMIEIITKRSIEKIVLSGKEQTEKPFFGSKGVRYDVKFIGDRKVYIIEMQNYIDCLIQRSVIYHSTEKMVHFQPGDGYESVVETCVIFICPYDYFAQGKAKYTLVTKIEECEDLQVDTGCTTILLNTSAHSEDAELNALLRYFATEEVGDTLTKRLEEAVEKTKEKNIVLEEFMRFVDYVKHEKEEAQLIGKEQGIQEGRKHGVIEEKRAICQRMLQDNLDIALIEKCTQLSKKEILEIQKLKNV